MESLKHSRVSIGSPVKSQSYNRLDQNKKSILKKLSLTFVHYSSRASRYAYKQINQKSFMELVADIFKLRGIELIKNTDQWKKILSLYHVKGKKNIMTFQIFLKVLPSVSHHFVKFHTPEEELRFFIQHIVDLYDKNIANQVEGKFVEFNTAMKKDTQQYMQKLADSLYKLYKVYFPQEITQVVAHINEPEEQAFQCVLTFFKQFQIYPKVMSASQLYMLFKEIIGADTENIFTWISTQHNRNDRLSIFNFARFAQLLVRVAVVCPHKLRQIQDPEWWSQNQKECLKAMFEYMQSVKSKNKNCRFNHLRFNFIVLEEYTNQFPSMNYLTERSGKNLVKKDFFEIFQNMKI